MKSYDVVILYVAVWHATVGLHVISRYVSVVVHSPGIAPCYGDAAAKSKHVPCALSINRPY